MGDSLSTGKRHDSGNVNSTMPAKAQYVVSIKYARKSKAYAEIMPYGGVEN